MHDEFRLHARAEFDYDLREEPLTEAALLSDIDAAAARSIADAPNGALAVAQQEHAESLGARCVSGSDQVPSHRRQSSTDIPWMQLNPLGVPTEREIYSSLDGGEAFRVLFVRQS